MINTRFTTAALIASLAASSFAQPVNRQPANNDTYNAILPDYGTAYSVALNSWVTIEQLTINGDQTTLHFDGINPRQKLQVNNGVVNNGTIYMGEQTLHTPTIEGTGIILLNESRISWGSLSIGANTTLQVGAGTSDLESNVVNHGTINLTDTTSSLTITPYQNNHRFENRGTIQGVGDLWLPDFDGAPNTVNRGTIALTGDNAYLFAPQPLNNPGSITLSDGARASLENQTTQTIRSISLNNPGIVAIKDTDNTGSHWLHDGVYTYRGTFAGGIVSAAPGAPSLAGTQLHDIKLGTDLTISSDLSGTLDLNQKTLTVTDNLSSQRGFAFANGGHIEIIDGGLHGTPVSAASERLAIPSTISVSMTNATLANARNESQIDIASGTNANLSSIENRHQIHAGDDVSLTLHLGTNHGTIQIGDNSTLKLLANTNHGTIIQGTGVATQWLNADNQGLMQTASGASHSKTSTQINSKTSTALTITSHSPARSNRPPKS